MIQEYPDDPNSFSWNSVYPVATMPPESLKYLGADIPQDKLKYLAVKTTKNVSYINGTELDVIRKVATVKWLNENNQLQTKEFVHMETTHKKVQN